MAKILVIDDDAMNIKMASFVLTKGNYEVISATSGQEGIEKIKTEAPDIILLDIEMPEMSGYETLEIIRQDETIKDSKVIFLTGTIDEKTKSEEARLGVIATVQKPFKAPELLGVVANV